MASVRAQILAAVEEKLKAVVEDLEWRTFIRNPREAIGEDQMNAIVMMDGGDREPAGLTGRVEEAELEFSVGWIAIEQSPLTAEELLDLALVRINDTLLNPADIQLGALAVDIRRTGISEPLIGRSADSGARILCGQSMDLAVRYFTREGDASTVGP